MNKTLVIIAVVILIAILAFFGYHFFTKDSNPNSLFYSTVEEPINNTNQETPPVTEEPKVETTEDTPAPASAVATFDTNNGSFKVLLDGKAAPKTVKNFIKLANEGFYNGLKFHRIVQDFMIQGGDPKGDGTGGPGYTVPAEIGLKHTKGAIAMARLGDSVNPDKDSSGSQFYITLGVQTFLDGQYTVFGYVSEGMNTVEKIGMTPTEPNPYTGEQSIPLKEVVINSITIGEIK